MNDRLFPPHPLVADLVHCLVVKDLPAGPYTLPATLQPVFLLVLNGRIRLHSPDGTVDVPRLGISGGTSGPRHATAEPGTRILVGPVRAGKLRTLLGLPALAVVERLLALDGLLPRATIDRVFEELQAAPAVVAQVAAFQRFLARLRTAAGTAGDDLLLPAAWFARPLADLADQFGIGIRQFERRFAASYGQSLRAYRHQQRCSRMISTVIGSRGQRDGWAAIAADAGYFDQAQLSRDVLRFTGYSPAELTRRIDGGDPAMWPYRVAPNDLTELFGEAGF